MPLNENEAARAAELRRSLEDLRPVVRDGEQRSVERRKRWRRTGANMAAQATSQAIGTLLAASVAYIAAVVAGALEGTQPLTIIVSLILGLGSVAALWEPVRYLLSPSRRADSRLTDASLELTGLEVRAKLRDGKPITPREAELIQLGAIRLDR